MKKVPLCLVIGIGFALPVSAMSARAREVTLRPNSKVAGIDLGGLTPPEAEKRLREWWEKEKLTALKVRCYLTSSPLPSLKPSDFGVGLDDVATVSKIPKEDSTKASGSLANPDYSERSFDPVFKAEGSHTADLEATVLKAIGKPHPAHVYLEKGAIVRIPEVSDVKLDEANLVSSVATALKGNHVVQVPLIQGEKRISDDQLSGITDVVSSFTTRFPKKQYSRNSNIKLASSKLDGVILLPGETLSFNGTVGPRTIQRGFKLAGVYKNGRHDTGIGGGICQVSTTLYNACIFGNIKIVRRSNHSMPVAYVPLGRDATVDYGNLDLVIQNNYPNPIAVSSAFASGTLTFRILGKKDPTLNIKLEQENGKSWNVGTKIVQDPKLPMGAREVVEKGSWGHSLTTYRLIFKNGVLAEKQLLNRSYYGGGEKIIAVGPSAPPVGVGSSLAPITNTRASIPPRTISRG